MADETEQDQLQELMDRFEQEQPELARQLAHAPVLPVDPPAIRYEASIRTGTSTESTGLAFVGSGTRRTQ